MPAQTHDDPYRKARYHVDALSPRLAGEGFDLGGTQGEWATMDGLATGRDPSVGREHRSGQLPPSVAHVVRANHEDDLFGHIGGMVGDALEILGHSDNAKARLHFVGVLGHMLRHRGNDGRVEVVNGVIARQYLVGFRVVPASIRGDMKRPGEADPVCG